VLLSKSIPLGSALQTARAAWGEKALIGMALAGRTGKRRLKKPSAAAKSPPLRAAGRSRRQALIKAATRLFLKHGFDSVSLDAIVKQAGGSKASIYDLFGNKESLFGAVVEDRCTHLLDAMATANPKGMPLRATLTAIAKQFMALILSRDALGLYRVVVAETPRFPNLGGTFFQYGPARAMAALAEYLETEMRAGRLARANAGQAAEHFIGLLISTYHLRAVLNLKCGSVPKHIDAAVSAFLQAYRL
jgi:AcrR family transcriptional regulator